MMAAGAMEPARLYHWPPAAAVAGDDTAGPAAEASVSGAAAASAWRVHAADGIGLRLAHWPAAAGAPAAGSVLLFPGRSEYIEKYAPVAAALSAAGLAVLIIDWRGQGASDRLLADASVGHVRDFAEYQRDVAAMVAAGAALDLPRPWHLLAHSMGGAIGLRALMQGLPVSRAAFTAPMWGIRFGALPDPVGAGMASGLARAARRTGRGNRAAPGASSVLDIAFSDNTLTSDLEQYIRMMRQAEAWPALIIGAPTFDWVRAAVAECRALARLPSPDFPALITLSGDEAIVSSGAIRRRAADWPGARLLDLPGARHEALFEQPETRARTMAAILAHFGVPGENAAG